jgi:hypothetical protein
MHRATEKWQLHTPYSVQPTCMKQGVWLGDNSEVATSGMQSDFKIAVAAADLFVVLLYMCARLERCRANLQEHPTIQVLPLQGRHA